MNKMFRTLLTASILIASVSTTAFADNYVVGQDIHTQNKVNFNSSTMLASFTGVTDKVEGNANVDLKNLKKSSGEIKVMLETLDTGIGKRNEHMKGVLNTAKNSLAIFKLKALRTTLKTLPAYKTVVANASGDLTINGVTKPVTTLLNLTYMPEKDKSYRQGNWIHLTTNFNVKLSDYGIKAPGIIPLKVNDTVGLVVDVMGMKK